MAAVRTKIWRKKLKGERSVGMLGQKKGDRGLSQGGNSKQEGGGTKRTSGPSRGKKELAVLKGGKIKIL